jgi:hypothetical protein
VFAGPGFSTDEILLLVLLFLVATAGGVAIGFAVGQWWVLLLAFVPMVFGSGALFSLPR